MNIKYFTSMLDRRNFVKASSFLMIQKILPLPYFTSLFGENEAFGQNGSAKNFFTFYIPNGINPYRDGWFPRNNQLNESKPSILRPYREDLTYIVGMHNHNRRGSGNAHLRAISGFLTAVTANDNARKVSVSLDVAFGAHMQSRGLSRIESMHLASNNVIDPPNGTSYNNALKNALSFDSDGNILSTTSNLRNQYNRLFNDLLSQRNQNENEKQSRLSEGQVKRQVFDPLLADIKNLQSKLGAADRKLLDAYLTYVEQIDTKIRTRYAESQEDRPAPSTTGSCRIPPREAFPNFNDSQIYNEASYHFDIVTDLAIAAFMCGLTRSISYFPGGEASKTQYEIQRQGNRNQSYYRNFHDQVSHNDGANNYDYDEVDRYHLRMFASFMRKLKDTGMLSNTYVLFGGGLGHGNNHTLSNIPFILGGGIAFSHRGMVNQSGSHAIAIATLAQALGLPGGRNFGENDGSTMTSVFK